MVHQTELGIQSVSSLTISAGGRDSRASTCRVRRWPKGRRAGPHRVSISFRHCQPRNTTTSLTIRKGAHNHDQLEIGLRPSLLDDP
jgi:hypothetical protein